MPQSLRSLLCWLLAVLMLGQALPANRTLECGGVGAGCETQSSCCCPANDFAVDDAPMPEPERCCDCKQPTRSPQPSPEPSMPKLSLPLCEPEPARAPPTARMEAVIAQPRADARLPRAHMPLPRVLRMIAYSVWRL